MDISKSLLRTFLPMAKDYVPKLEQTLADKLHQVQLMPGEEFAGYVLVDMNGTLYIVLCTFTHQNNMARQLEQYPAKELLLKLFDNV